MWGEPRQARSATMALTYVTLGALMAVWTVIYYLYLRGHGASDGAYLWCYGFFFSGLVLMAIGFAVGRIGGAAREAEVAPMPTTQVVMPPTAAVTAVAPQATTRPVTAASAQPLPEERRAHVS